MSEAKFTKGEWTAYCPQEVLNSGHVSVEGEDGGLICISPTYKRTLVEDVANAHLIAAAPEMYEMLERLHDQLIDINSHDSVKEIEQLLAKARGEK